MAAKKKPTFLVVKYLPIIFLGILVALVYSYIFFVFSYQNKIYPKVKIAGQDMGGKTRKEASGLLAEQFSQRVEKVLQFSQGKQSFTIDLTSSSPQFDLQSSVEKAYTFGRSGLLNKDLPNQIQALFFVTNFTPTVTFKKPSQLLSQIKNINQVVRQEPLNARLILDQGVTIVPAEEGVELDDQALKQKITDYLTLTSSAPTNLPTKVILPKFSTAKAQSFKTLLINIGRSPIQLIYEDNLLTIDQKTLYHLLYLGENTEDTDNNIISSSKLSSYLASLSEKIDQPTFDAKFTFDPNTKKVTEFQPAQEGRRLDIDQTATLLTEALFSPVASPAARINLPVAVTKPKIQTAEVNNFGIKDLLGEGVSYFAGSIDNRIHNIKLATARVNGLLVPPGETFSFNQALGDVSAETGYKQAYVIKSGRTVLDDGGGVCQVSTTLFRALLNAGLPITARSAHAYRVGYYEQGFPPGLDATVYPPAPDLKFKNDTSSYILIQASVVGTTLYFNLYGASDGRKVEVTKPIITDQTPPLPELRQDDPTLLKGVVKQVDWAAPGANVSFQRTVTRSSETLIKETWRSNYRPWQAIYLVGTKE